MKILIACEFSGRVRDEFIRLGFDAVSCDLLPSDAPGPHYRGDVRDLLSLERFDLMIAFPPCTYLASSGIHWNSRRPERARLTDEAVEFFRFLLDAPIPRIAVENPVGVISTRIRPPDQYIHPWQFGEDASKKTCLWLKNLPSLIPTNVIKKERYSNQTPSGQNKLGPSPDRWKLRSLTYPGIARAMAEQWSMML